MIITIKQDCLLI